MCGLIGGVWRPDIKWCESTKRSAPAMEAAGEQLNLTMACKLSNDTSANEGSPHSYRPSLIPILLMVMMMVAGSHSMAVPHSNSSSSRAIDHMIIRDRPRPCMKKVVPVGDGSLHPSCLFHQVTGILGCNNQECPKLKTDSRTFSWSIGGDGKGGSFSSAGFDVSESYTSESSEVCGADSTGGQKVCAIAQISYLEYTVKEEIIGDDCINVRTEPYIIRAPDKSKQKKFQCAADKECHYLDWESWEHNGQPCPLAVQ